MRRFWMGFVFAGRGIAACVRAERNFRFHLWAGALVLWMAARYYPFTAAEWAVLLLGVALVLALEAVNSAIERAVAAPDRAHDAFAGQAKDMAAGAVLLGCVGAAAMGVALFWRPAVLGAIWAAWLAHPLRPLALVCYLTIGGRLVFCPPWRQRAPQRQTADALEEATLPSQRPRRATDAAKYPGVRRQDEDATKAPRL